MAKLSWQLQEHQSPALPVLLWGSRGMLLTLLCGVEGCFWEAGTGNIYHGYILALSFTFLLSTELERQLVALIPYGDQRLKPRHT